MISSRKEDKDMTMTMTPKQELILNVPYRSQNDDKIESKWRNRACGIVCVSMVASYYNLDDTDVMSLIDEAVLIGGHKKGGWMHDSLVRLLRNQGLHSYPEEFRSVEVDLEKKLFKPSPFSKKLERSGIVKIAHEIRANRPVIVSVHPTFRHNSENHMVVIIGFRGGLYDPTGFIIHDPDNRKAPGDSIFVDRPYFEKFWRKSAIFSGLTGHNY